MCVTLVGNRKYEIRTGVNRECIFIVCEKYEMLELGPEHSPYERYGTHTQQCKNEQNDIKLGLSPHTLLDLLRWTISS